MNILNDNWLFVRYLNGKVKQISVRQAFQDAEKIKNIETPTFHGTTISLYDVPVIQLLSIILLAAYFKPKNKFKAADTYFNKNLTEKGWDIKVINDYLDKWQDRFNLFDDKYPFLQDIRLKNEIKEDAKESLSYISRSNLVAPGGNNLIFEHNSTSKLDLIDFKPDLDELVYMLLYLRTLGTSPMAAQYPYKAMSANATLFILNYGKNLKETIIANCLPLRNSNRDTNLYDKPIWEFNSFDELLDYDLGDISKNVLLCTYFPCPMYIQYDNGVKNILLAKAISTGKTNYDIFDSETRAELSASYAYTNPWAIKKYVIDKKSEIGTWSYKEWTNTLKLMNLCIEITQKSSQDFICDLFNSEFQANEDVKSIIYYREYDGMKSNVLSFGKYIVEKGILNKLQKEKNHKKAVEFQTVLNKVQSKFAIFNDSGISNANLKDIKLLFSKYAENYFFDIFVNDITKKDCVENALDVFIKEAKNIVKKLEVVTNNPLKYAQAYRMFCGSLNKLKEGKEVKQ